MECKGEFAMVHFVWNIALGHLRGTVENWADKRTPFSALSSLSNFTFLCPVEIQDRATSPLSKQTSSKE